MAVPRDSVEGRSQEDQGSTHNPHGPVQAYSLLPTRLERSLLVGTASGMCLLLLLRGNEIKFRISWFCVERAGKNLSHQVVEGLSSWVIVAERASPQLLTYWWWGVTLSGYRLVGDCPCLNRPWWPWTLICLTMVLMVQSFQIPGGTHRPPSGKDLFVTIAFPFCFFFFLVEHTETWHASALCCLLCSPPFWQQLLWVFQTEEHLYQGNVTFDFWSVCSQLFYHP